jgi:site-specific DNA recombinase
MDLIGYIRVSTEDQAAGGHSLALAQPQAVEQLAARLGGRLAHVIVDGEGQGDDFRGVSGGLPLFRRKGGRELIQRLRAGEAQGVIAYSLERMFRNVDDGRAFFQQYGIKRGVQVTTVTEGTLDPTTVTGWMLVNNLLLFGELERMRTGERTRYAVQAMRAAGKVHGTTPYGCVAVGGLLFRDPQAWAMRAHIVGMRERDIPFKGISDELRRQRVPAPDGGVRWSTSTLRRICESHESWSHLPWLDQPASTTPACTDTADSDRQESRL